MGWKGCRITLDSPLNAYYSGQRVNGKLVFTFDTATKMRGIRIKFHGEAHTQWNRSKSYRDRNGEIHYIAETLRGEEQFLNIQYYLLGGKNSAEIQLPAGEHTFDFSCNLPLHLPSSFEGKWGNIRYGIKITLDKRWRLDQNNKLVFTVISTVNLNKNLESKESFSLDIEKSFGCLCWRSGPLSLMVSLPVTGYVPGQNISIIAVCENASNVRVNYVSFILHQVVVFETKYPQWDKKIVNNVIAGFRLGPLANQKSHTFRENLDIPNSHPLNSDHCCIIKIHYELKVIAKVSGFHRNLEGEIPIMLGTIAFV